MCKDKDSGCLDMGRGCMFPREGDEADMGVREGCFKLHETDWLENLPAMDASDIFEVRFKNTRRSYYRNENGLELKRGDIVAVESSPGHDIGIVSLTGDMVARQMRRVGFNPLNGEFRKIYRKAKPYDIEKWQEAIALEHNTMIRARRIAAEMGLNMKIGDVEYQGDKLKAIFYYIADERVDFRELIKVFAEQFRIRVEMKQIGARQEAGRIGGLGACGRELCCASWIASFISVTTNSARAQEISLNPQKLAGQCSKLKCCLVYELDDYLDARREFPRVHQPLQALDGDYHLVKTDILGRRMSFSTSPNAMIGVVTLPISRVREIIEVNKRGRKVDRLEDVTTKPVQVEDPGFVNMAGEESITRFDSGGNGGRRRGKRREGPRDGGRENQHDGGEKRNDGRNGQRNGERHDERQSEQRTNREQRGEGGQKREQRGGRNGFRGDRGDRATGRTSENQGGRQGERTNDRAPERANTRTAEHTGDNANGRANHAPRRVQVKKQVKKEE